MSELKATTAQEIVRNEKDCDYMDELFGGVKMPPTQVYLKSEADKVIEDLKAKLKVQTSNAEEAWKLKDSYHTDYSEAVEELFKKNKQLRHNKYKRCLAMARMCEERYNYLTCLENWQMTDKEYQQVIGDYWDRWNTRWLKIAEKFKDKEA